MPPKPAARKPNAKAVDAEGPQEAGAAEVVVPLVQQLFDEGIPAVLLLAEMRAAERERARTLRNDRMVCPLCGPILCAPTHW